MRSVDVDPVDVKERSVDPQGRVSVGTDYAGETVRVAVVETVGEDPSVWHCQYCETAMRSVERPETCVGCDVEGDALTEWETVDIEDVDGSDQ